MTAEQGEPQRSLEAQIESLNAKIGTTGLGPEVDERLSLYHQLPESIMAASVGGDLAFDFGQSGAKMFVRPIATYGKAVLVVDMTGPRSIQDKLKYFFLRGSIYFPDEEQEKHGKQAISDATTTLISRGEATVGRADNGVVFAYNPRVFCREAQLVYSEAHPVERLLEKTSRTQTASKGLLGMVITIQPAPNRPLTLLVEHDYFLTPPIKNITHNVGSDTHKLLSYTS